MISSRHTFARRALLFCLILSLSGGIARADVELLVGPAEFGGQYATLQAAVDAVPASNTVRHVIKILPGSYNGRVIVPDNKPFITFRGLGQGSAETVIRFNHKSSPEPGESNESTNFATAVIRGKDFIAENLTFENYYGTGSQALAIYARGDRAVFNNVRFIGNQDTLRSESGRHYFYNSYVEGTVDFIYGKGTAYFENMMISPKSSGYVTAQAREQMAETNGFVFKNATITGPAANNTVYLGRPWQAYSRSIFIDTKMSADVRPEGWSVWSGNNNHLTSYFAEHNSMDLNGVPLVVTGRPSWTYQLSAAQIAPYSKQAWLTGTDSWNPIATNTPPPLADFNGDDDISGEDFLIWQQGYGLTGQTDNSYGDADFDGDVDFIDQAIWEFQLRDGGPLNAANVAVPEPASLVLIVASLLVQHFFFNLRIA